MVRVPLGHRAVHCSTPYRDMPQHQRHLDHSRKRSHGHMCVPSSPEAVVFPLTLPWSRLPLSLSAHYPLAPLFPLSLPSLEPGSCYVTQMTSSLCFTSAGVTGMYHTGLFYVMDTVLALSNLKSLYIRNHFSHLF